MCFYVQTDFQSSVARDHTIGELLLLLLLLLPFQPSGIRTPACLQLAGSGPEIYLQAADWPLVRLRVALLRFESFRGVAQLVVTATQLLRVVVVISPAVIVLALVVVIFAVIVVIVIVVVVSR